MYSEQCYYLSVSYRLRFVLHLNENGGKKGKKKKKRKKGNGMDGLVLRLPGRVMSSQTGRKRGPSFLEAGGRWGTYSTYMREEERKEGAKEGEKKD